MTLPEASVATAMKSDGADTITCPSTRSEPQFVLSAPGKVSTSRLPVTFWACAILGIPSNKPVRTKTMATTCLDLPITPSKGPVLSSDRRHRCIMCSSSLPDEAARVATTCVHSVPYLHSSGLCWQSLLQRPADGYAQPADRTIDGRTGGTRGGGLPERLAVG